MSGRVGDDGDDGAEVEAGFVALEVGRVEARDDAVEVERIGRAELVAESALRPTPLRRFRLGPFSLKSGCSLPPSTSIGPDWEA